LSSNHEFEFSAADANDDWRFQFQADRDESRFVGLVRSFNFAERIDFAGSIVDVSTSIVSSFPGEYGAD
jgi:hypothetical protein